MIFRISLSATCFHQNAIILLPGHRLLPFLLCPDLCFPRQCILQHESPAHAHNCFDNFIWELVPCRHGFLLCLQLRDNAMSNLIVTPALSGFMTGAPERPVGLLVAQPSSSSSSFAHPLHNRPSRRAFPLLGLSHFAANVALLGDAAVGAHVFALPSRCSR